MAAMGKGVFYGKLFCLENEFRHIGWILRKGSNGKTVKFQMLYVNNNMWSDACGTFSSNLCNSLCRK